MLVGFVEVKKCLDVGAVEEAAVALHLLEFFGLVIAPAAFGQEGVEDENLFFVGSAAMDKTPLEDLVVRGAGEDLLDDGWIVDVEESADAGVSAGSVLVVGRKFALSVQPDFIEHASEEDEAIDLFGGMSETGDFHDVVLDDPSWRGSQGARARWEMGVMGFMGVMGNLRLN